LYTNLVMNSASGNETPIGSSLILRFNNHKCDSHEKTKENIIAYSKVQ
jgi:hypothetical protein